MFYSHAEEKKELGGREGEIVPHIFHKYRLRWQLVPALWFPTKNGEQSNIIVENLPQLSPACSGR